MPLSRIVRSSPSSVNPLVASMLNSRPKMSYGSLTFDMSRVVPPITTVIDPLLAGGWLSKFQLAPVLQLLLLPPPSQILPARAEYFGNMIAATAGTIVLEMAYDQRAAQRPAVRRFGMSVPNRIERYEARLIR
jgi:hypothetical protein